MTYVITTPCIDVQDQACVEVCPVDCIHFDEGKDRMLYINPDECIDCGACEPACPVTSIFAEEEVRGDQEAFKEINVTWYSDKDDGRGKVPVSSLAAGSTRQQRKAARVAAFVCPGRGWS